MSRGSVAVVAAVVFVIAFAVHTRVLKPPIGRWPAAVWPTIVQMQQAGSGRRMVGIMEKLGREGRSRLRVALWVDAAIIAGYVILLWCWVAWSDDVVRRDLAGDLRDGGAFLAGLAAVAVGVAGALDAVEDLALGLVTRRWRDELDDLSGPDLQDARREAARRSHVPAVVAKVATNIKLGLLALVLVWLGVAAVIALAS